MLLWVMARLMSEYYIVPQLHRQRFYMRSPDFKKSRVAAETLVLRVVGLEIPFQVPP
jgi:hypothetical protein